MREWANVKKLTVFYPMLIVICAATELELAPFRKWISANKPYSQNEPDIQLLVHGVGMVATTHALTAYCFQQRPFLIVQVGIAGTFSRLFNKPELFLVEREQIGDAGVVEKKQWNDLFDMNLVEKSRIPFLKGYLPNPYLPAFSFLDYPHVTGISVNQISTGSMVRYLRNKYSPTLESMEGAALHYVGRMCSIPFLQIRATSNKVGERDKSKWQIQEAISEITTALKCLVSNRHLINFGS
jgi:futalosine hydrolase